MKQYLFSLLLFIGSFSFGQDYDYQQLCINCAEAQGFYCGDDPSNWTQYAPNGCVQNSWINDGWIDCVDASDEGEDVVPTSPMDCIPPPPDCDTVYVDIPVIEYVYLTDTIPFYIYETIIQLDTIVETEYITQIVVDTVEVDVEVFIPEYIYVTDTLWMEGALDTMYVDVIDTLEIEVVVFDTIIQTEYVEIFVVDSIIEYVEVINTEYIDCDTGLPCNSNIPEIIEQSKKDNILYNLLGQAIREPNGLYIEGGKVKYKLK
jgi:hypothetical protein